MMPVQGLMHANACRRAHAGAKGVWACADVRVRDDYVVSVGYASYTPTRMHACLMPCLCTVAWRSARSAGAARRWMMVAVGGLLLCGVGQPLESLLCRVSGSRINAVHALFAGCDVMFLGEHACVCCLPRWHRAVMQCPVLSACACACMLLCGAAFACTHCILVLLLRAHMQG